MEATQFDCLTRTLSSLLSRRRLAGALALAAATLPSLSAAKMKRKRKNKKRKRQQTLVRNAFGCVDVGMPCRGSDDNCCSGVCQGKKPKKGKKDTSRCAAHNAADCLAAADICTGISPICETNGFCFRTTGKASFCGQESFNCTGCQKDSDCEAEFGPGAACVVCVAACDETGTSCTPAAP